MEVWEQAQKDNVEAEDELSPLFFHLAGVALARLGRKDEAVAQWETALELYDNYPLAQENLTDIRHTVESTPRTLAIPVATVAAAGRCRRLYTDY